ncbi:MAG: SEC-C metal-binding domain-containing protein [Nitrospiraceae bacterium]
MKIGRNDPCPCGSGKKFKKCHNNPRFELPFLIQQAPIEKHLEEEGKRLLEQQRAKEIQRQHQQGLGRPIISVEFQSYRFVAVGSKVHYGKWKTFHDFLGNYIKSSLGGEWGNTELRKPLAERHPILKWYEGGEKRGRESFLDCATLDLVEVRHASPPAPRCWRPCLSYPQSSSRTTLAV